MPTIIISAVIGILVAAIIIKEIKNRNSGKCSCGSDSCALKDKCHK